MFKKKSSLKLRATLYKITVPLPVSPAPVLLNPVSGSPELVSDKKKYVIRKKLVVFL